MGIRISVYRTHRPDCSRNGVSAQHDTLCLINAEGPFEPVESEPAAKLIISQAGIPIIVPADFETRAGHRMFGGNFAGTSDGRFGDLIWTACKDAGLSDETARAFARSDVLPIHDRFDPWV